MTVFDRGDYRAFLVVAPADDIDRVLYAFPIFEGEKVSDVFKYYRYLYFPDAAKIKYRRDGNLDDESRLGFMLADVKVGTDQFKVSTITPAEALWYDVVAQWEDQWVFDHLVATTGAMPPHQARDFKGGKTIQGYVGNWYDRKMLRVGILVFTAFLGLIVWSMVYHSEQEENNG